LKPLNPDSPNFSAKVGLDVDTSPSYSRVQSGNSISPSGRRNRKARFPSRKEVVQKIEILQECVCEAVAVIGLRTKREKNIRLNTVYIVIGEH
jgi:hypothetical protein